MSIENNKALFVTVPFAIGSLISCSDENKKNEMLTQQAEVIQTTREDITKDSLVYFIDQLNQEDMKLFLSYTLPLSFDFKKIEDIQRYIKIRQYIMDNSIFTQGEIDGAVKKNIKSDLYSLSFETVADIEQYASIRNDIVVNTFLSNDDIDDYVFDKMIEQLAHNDL